MQIACEKCSTQYVLDERVIPPGGAPVQCTRCGHVFVAMPAEPSRASTQLFGPTPSDPARTTQLFGKGKPPEAAPRSSTQVFGTAQATDAAAPRSSTQMFGVAKDAEAAAPRSTTQMFGVAKEPEPAAPRSSTQMFGVAKEPEPAAPRSSTQMFGVAKEPEPAAPRSSTQMFGVATDAEPAAARSSTQMFGVAQDAEPAAPRSSTQMFGVAGQGGAEPRSSTQPFGAVSPDQGAPRTTQMFGAASAEQPAAPRHQTQIFGRSPPAGQDPARTTQVFGKTGPGGGAAPARVDLPPEEPAFAPGLGEDEVAGDAPASFRGTPTVRRSRAPLFAIVAVLVVAAGAFVSWRSLSKRASEIPADARVAYETAVRELRRDDAGSRASAEKTLSRIVAQHRSFTEARATLVVAVLFQLDELRSDRRVLEEEQAYLTDRVTELSRVRSPEDWETRIAVANERLTQLGAELAILERDLSSVEGRIASLKPALDAAAPDSPEAVRAVLGAQALHEAVLGNASAIVLSTRYKSQAADGWGALAYAEFALNSGAPPDTLAQAREELDALRVKDVSFIRSYVLSGRLAMQQRDYDAAISAFERAILLNPEHPYARAQLARAQQKARE